MEGGDLCNGAEESERFWIRRKLRKAISTTLASLRSTKANSSKQSRNSCLPRPLLHFPPLKSLSCCTPYPNIWSFQFVKHDSSTVKFPQEREDGAVPSFVCVSFREGARVKGASDHGMISIRLLWKDMVGAWVKAFRAIASRENCFRIHVIEHRVGHGGQRGEEGNCLLFVADVSLAIP